MGWIQRWLRADVWRTHGPSHDARQDDRPQSAQVQPPDPRDGFQLSFDLDGGSLQAEDALLEQIAGISNARISRSAALQVPAVLKARNIIAGIPSTLPINVLDRDREIDDRNWVVQDPDPELESSVVYSQTVEDMLFYGIAYWRVSRFNAQGFPVEAFHVDQRSVSPGGRFGMPSEVISADHQFTPRDTIFIDGLSVPRNQIIRFVSPIPPLLTHAARAIRMALLLDKAAERYTRDPLPLGYFTPREDADPLDDEEVTELLNNWEKARQQRAWGYISQGLEPHTLQWDPEKLQLNDARQHAVLEIARASGLDAEDVGVSTTSRTYFNAEQRRLDLIDFTLQPFLTAIENRLSKNDVTPRGLSVHFDPTGFLRSDMLTRMQAYQIGQRTGAWTTREIRRQERKPDLPAGEEPAGNQPPETMGEANMATNDNQRPLKLVGGFQATDVIDDVVPMSAPEADAQFRVDRSRRTISGLVLPWGQVARSGFARWRFKRGSLRWSETSRVKLLRDHNMTNPVGLAIDLQDREDGLHGTFSIARGPAGDEVLSLAEDRVLDGFSAGPMFEEGDEWTRDPVDDDVRLVLSSRLVEVTVTALPAFDSARVSKVNASLHNQEGQDQMTQSTQQAAGAAADTGNSGGATELTHQDAAFEQFTQDLTERLRLQSEKTVEALSSTIATAFDSAFQHLQDADAGGRGEQAAARFRVMKEPPVYRFNAAGVGDPSMVRDAWRWHRDGDYDSRDRLRRFQDQQQNMVHLQTVSTTNHGDVVPPGYRPDLFVTQLGQGRPILNLFSRGTITDATPFTVPRFASMADNSGTDGTQPVGDHTEGSNPDPGVLVVDSVVVSPGAVSGIFDLTREIVDSSNPAIDAIALNAMRESWNQQTEAKAYAALNGNAGTTVVLTDPADGVEVSDEARDILARYPFERFAAPSGAVMNQPITRALAGAKDNSGRPLFPSIGAENSSGLGNAVTQGWSVDGLPFVPAWAMTAGLSDDAAIVLNQQDVWAWESPILTFRFEEKRGPAVIQLALFGYFGVHVLQPAGVFALQNPAT